MSNTHPDIQGFGSLCTQLFYPSQYYTGLTFDQFLVKLRNQLGQNTSDFSEQRKAFAVEELAYINALEVQKNEQQRAAQEQQHAAQQQRQRAAQEQQRQRTQPAHLTAEEQKEKDRNTIIKNISKYTGENEELRMIKKYIRDIRAANPVARNEDIEYKLDNPRKHTELAKLMSNP